jgi:hypothetical protein
MFDHEETDQDLKAFEARLASLRPRTDGLDLTYRAMLEKEARRLCFSITPADQQHPRAASRSENTVMLKHNLRACTDPAGHRFVCVHCGNEASVSTRRRWAWPAALAAMSGVAAVLLAMLVLPHMYPAPTAGRFDVAASPANLAEDAQAGWPTRRDDEDKTSYLCLREQVLRHGVEWPDRPQARTSGPTAPTEGPLTNRELLDRLIEEQGLRGS